MFNIQKKLNSVSEKIELKDEIKSGPLSKIFICNFNNIKSIIRFDLSLVSKLKIDRSNEINILEEISYLNLAPNILYTNLNKGILIWEYIPGSEISITKKNHDIILIDLGRVLKKVHQFKLTKKNTKEFNQSISFYKNLLSNSLDQKIINKGLTLYNEIMDDNLPNVFSHNDLNKSNLLISNKIHFLDWEYASMNHPYFDIASLVVALNLNPEGINKLWQGYSDNSSFVDQSKLNRWVNFTYYLDYLWRRSIVELDDSYTNSMQLDKFESFLLKL